MVPQDPKSRSQGPMYFRKTCHAKPDDLTQRQFHIDRSYLQGCRVSFVGGYELKSKS